LQFVIYSFAFCITMQNLILNSDFVEISRKASSFYVHSIIKHTREYEFECKLNLSVVKLRIIEYNFSIQNSVMKKSKT
jgi:hypothetical protein